MKTILVPIDFSATSITAFRYALAVAPVLGITEIKLISVYHEPYSMRDEIGYIATVEIEKTKKACEERLLEFIELENMHSPLSVIVTFNAIHGYASESIIQAAQNPDTEMIVMGTTGIQDTMDKWLGTVSANVMQKANRPVLLVPNGRKYLPVKKILYACDFSKTDFDLHTEGIVAELAEKLKAEIKVLFIKQDDKEYVSDQNVMKQILKTDAPNTTVTTAVVENPSTAKAIQEYAIEKDFDWVVVSTQRRNFFQNLFHHSTSKELAFQTILPLLVIHAEDWEADRVQRASN